MAKEIIIPIVPEINQTKLNQGTKQATNKLESEFKQSGKQAGKRAGDELKTELVQKSKEAGKQAGGGFNTMFASVFTGAALGNLAVAALQKVGQSFKEMRTLASEQGKAERQLKIALGGSIDTLKEYALAMEQVTTFSDEAILQAQSMLAPFVKDTKAIKDITKVALDFSSATGTDLTTSMEMFSTALTGTRNPFKKYGIDLSQAKTQQEKINMLLGQAAPLWAGQAESAGKTTGGRFAQAEHMLDNFKAKIGILMNKVLIEFTPMLIDIAKGLEGTFEMLTPIIMPIIKIITSTVQTLYNELKPAFEDLGATTQSILPDILELLKEILEIGIQIVVPIIRLAVALMPLAKYIVGIAVAVKLWTVAQAALNAVMIMNPVTAIIVGVVALIGVMGALSNAYNKTAKEVKQEHEAQADLIKKQKEANKEQQLNLNNKIKVVEKLKEEASQLKTTAEKNELLKNKYGQLNEVYPGVIKSTDDFDTAMNKLAVSTGKSITKLSELQAGMIKLDQDARNVAVRISKDNVNIAQAELRKAMAKSMSSGEWLLDALDSAWGAVMGSNLANKSADGLMQAFAKGVHNASDIETISVLKEKFDRVLIKAYGSEKKIPTAILQKSLNFVQAQIDYLDSKKTQFTDVNNTTDDNTEAMGRNLEALRKVSEATGIAVEDLELLSLDLAQTTKGYKALDVAIYGQTDTFKTLAKQKKELEKQAKKDAAGNKTEAESLDELIKKWVEAGHTLEEFNKGMFNADFISNKYHTEKKFADAAEEIKKALAGVNPELAKLVTKVETLAKIRMPELPSLIPEGEDLGLSLIEATSNAWTVFQEKFIADEQNMQNVLIDLSGAIGNLFSDLLTNQENVMGRFLIALLDMTQKAVNVIGVEILAKKYAAWAALPIAGAFAAFGEWVGIMAVINGALTAAKAGIGAEEGTDMFSSLLSHKGKVGDKDTVPFFITPKEARYGILSDKALDRGGTLASNREIAQLMNSGVSAEDVIIRRYEASKFNDNNIVGQLQLVNNKLSNMEQVNMRVAKKFESHSKIKVDVRDNRRVLIEQTPYWRD